jgi:hypothetical protein
MRIRIYGNAHSCLRCRARVGIVKIKPRRMRVDLKGGLRRTAGGEHLLKIEFIPLALAPQPPGGMRDQMKLAACARAHQPPGDLFL